MQTIKKLKNGNSQSARIPAEIAYDRNGEEVRIRPVRRKLDGVLAKFAAFSPDFTVPGHEDLEQAERQTL